MRGQTENMIILRDLYDADSQQRTLFEIKRFPALIGDDGGQLSCFFELLQTGKIDERDIEY